MAGVTFNTNEPLPQPKKKRLFKSKEMKWAVITVIIYLAITIPFLIISTTKGYNPYFKQHFNTIMLINGVLVVIVWLVTSTLGCIAETKETEEEKQKKKIPKPIN